MLNWYGNTKQTREILTGTALWYTRGQQPMPIRWVMVADPEGKEKVEAFFSTDLELTPIRGWGKIRVKSDHILLDSFIHKGFSLQRN